MHLWRLTGIYLLGLVLCAVLLAGLAHATSVYFHRPMPTGVSAVGFIILAMLAGARYAKLTGEKPEPGIAWTLSLWFTFLQAVIAVGMLVAMGYFRAPETVRMIGQPHFPQVAAAFGMFLFLLVLLASRGALHIGVKTQLKQATPASGR